MTLDVSQATGIDYRARGLTVHLPPAVQGVRYSPRDSNTTVEVVGDRPLLARVLRAHGYTVVWDDPNPAVALASRVSPARVQAAQINGARSPGRPRSVAKLCPEPLRTSLATLDKGALADIVFVAAGSAAEGRRAVQYALAARATLDSMEEDE